MHQVRYFLALCDTLNFTRAAERCNVSQPSLTRAIKALEESLDGGILVSRERGKTHLTEFGRMMRPYCEQILFELETAKSRAKDYVRLTGTTLRVGLMSTIGPGRLVELFTRFMAANPGVDINLIDGPTPLIEEQLAQGALDVAIYARPQRLDDRFHAMALFDERFMVALAPNDPLARKNVIRMRDLNQKHYLGRASCEFYEHLRRIRLEIGGIEFKRRYSSDRDDWVQSMVLAGLGFTYIPEFAVACPGLVALPLAEPEVTRTVKLVTVRGRLHSPAVGAFVLEARHFPWAGKVKSAL